MGRSGNEDVVTKTCKDCGGNGRGTIPGTLCPTCRGSGQTVTVIHRR